VTSTPPAPAAGAPRRLPAAPTILGLAVLLVLVLLASAAVGDVRIPLGEAARAVFHRPLPGLVPAPADETTSVILWDLRLPRVVLAALVGAALSVAGAALQGLIGNPLADPYTVGVSSGAAVGAGLAILFGIGGLFGGLMLAGCAFGAALLTMLLVFALARVGGRLHTASFLLAGIVAGSFLWAVMTLLLTLARTEQGAILLWLMGRFSDADWAKVGLLAPFVAAGVALYTMVGRGLDAFAFGEDVARSVGVEVERFKAGGLALAALLTAAAVAVSGIVGFVGLVVPHCARALVGAPHRVLIPTSALLGRRSPRSPTCSRARSAPARRFRSASSPRSSAPRSSHSCSAGRWGASRRGAASRQRKRAAPARLRALIDVIVELVADGVRGG
jgi:iron complex transport system permease protein